MIYYLSTLWFLQCFPNRFSTHTQRRLEIYSKIKTKFCLVAEKEEESKGTRIINTCDYREKGLTVGTVGNGEGKLGALLNRE